MTEVERPIFVVAVGDEYVSPPVQHEDCIGAFGTLESARAYVGELAKREGKPASLYRIVEYGFTGKVREG
jgi:hypothetical protein